MKMAKKQAHNCELSGTWNYKTSYFI